MHRTIFDPYRSARHGSITDLRLQCDLLISHGYDAEAILRSAAIAPDILGRADASITRRQEQEFLSAFAVTTSNRPDIWVNSGQRYNCMVWGAFGLAVLTAPTLSDATRLAGTFGSGSGRYRPLPRTRWSSGVEVLFDPEHIPGTPEYDFRVTREVLSALDTYNSLWGSPLPLLRIELPAEFGVDLSPHVSPPIHHSIDASVRFVWPVEADEEPLPRGDALLHREYVAVLNRQDLLAPEIEIEEQVREVFARTNGHMTSLAAVAQELQMATRTLQRRLASRGVAFSALREECRLSRAQRMLLSSNHPIGHISRELGYLEVSSFSHAFRRRVGMSPRSYRELHADA